MNDKQIERLSEHLLRWRNWYLFVAIIVACAAYYWSPYTHTVFRELNRESSANKYLAEFVSYKYPEVSSLAPDGRLKIVEKSGPARGPWSIFDYCHTFWIEWPDGTRQILIKADELEPGSGRSYSVGWSKDSKAIFIKGGYRALDCRGESGSFNNIYTVDDGILWEVPHEY